MAAIALASVKEMQVALDYALAPRPALTPLDVGDVSDTDERWRERALAVGIILWILTLLLAASAAYTSHHTRKALLSRYATSTKKTE